MRISRCFDTRELTRKASRAGRRGLLQPYKQLRPRKGWCESAHTVLWRTVAGNGNSSPDHKLSPHSVRAEGYLITQPREALLLLETSCFCLLNSGSGKQPLGTIHTASFSIPFPWRFIGKGCNSYFSSVGGAAMKTPGLLIFMMNIHDLSNLYSADFVALSFSSLLPK